MKKNIALVTGGYSGESVISYKSAESIFQNIDSEKWNCFIKKELIQLNKYIMRIVFNLSFNK